MICNSFIFDLILDKNAMSCQSYYIRKSKMMKCDDKEQYMQTGAQRVVGWCKAAEGIHGTHL